MIKQFLFVGFLLVFFNNLALAQINYQNFSTATMNWSVTGVDGSCNVQPLTPAQINALGFGGAVIYGECPLMNPIAMPISAGFSCYQADNLTYFFRYILDPFPQENLCLEGSFRATADNYFRMYVNGTQVQAPFYTGLSNCSMLNNWNGNDWTIGFSNTFSNLLNPFPAVNSIVVEVLNASEPGPNNHPLFFDGAFNISSLAAVTATFNQSFNGGPTLDTLTLANTGVGSRQTWLIETSNSSSGPWSFLTTSTNTRLGASQKFLVPKCTWIRVSHTVTFGNCAATVVMVLRQCPGFRDEILEEQYTSPNSTSRSLGEEDAYTFSLGNDLQNYEGMNFKSIQDTLENSLNGGFFSVFPNPTNGNLTFNLLREDSEIYNLSLNDNLGRTVYENFNFQGKISLNLSDLPAGMFFATIRDSKGVVISSKKVFFQK